MPGNSAQWADGISSSLPCLVHGEKSATRGIAGNLKKNFTVTNLTVYRVCQA